MSGKVLIVDELATNRIVLKVKLSAAYYHVLQAGSAAEALEIARLEKPDLIVSSDALSDMQTAAFIAALRADTALAATPMVVILPNASETSRVAALQSGADEVLSQPLSEDLMLARLRNLMRKRNGDRDVQLHAHTAQALGFGEARSEFKLPGRVAAVAVTRAEALSLQTRLSAHSRHKFTPLAVDRVMSFVRDKQPPDVFVLRIRQDEADEGMRLLAELRAAQATRHCPVMVVLDRVACGMAATVLDLGAQDVICDPARSREMKVRIDRLLHRKRTDDRFRDQLQSGLEAAVIDPLTGLYNRRYALPFLKRLTEQTGPQSRSFAVMVVDLDFFKSVNDRFGHAGGDEVLRRVAGELSSGLGHKELVARLGGEEFLIVLPDTGRAEAQRMAADLCERIRQMPIRLPGQSRPVHVTISIGVTLAQPMRDGVRPTVDALLDQADRALYGSKAGGRNTVTFNLTRPAA